MKIAILLLLLPMLGLGTKAFAHTPLFACYDNADGTVLCEGGFSDGSSAAGVPVRVFDTTGEVLLEGQLDQLSEFEFAKPDTVYSVLFDGGEGHRINIPSTQILP